MHKKVIMAKITVTVVFVKKANKKFKPALNSNIAEVISIKS